MVLLNMMTNSNSTIIANFESEYNETYINFQNNKSCIFAAGILDNSFKIYDKNNSYDYGLSYFNNTLSTRNINALSFKNNDYSVFPNAYTETFIYNINAIPGYSGVNTPTDCFTIDTNTYWESRLIYSLTFNNPDTNGTVLTQKNIYNFNNLAYGEFITINFPYKVIPIGFTVNSIGKKHDPKKMVVFLSNDNINWVKQFEGLLKAEINLFTNNYSEYNNFYKYITFVITHVTNDDYNIATESTTYFKINNLVVYTKSVLFLDNNIKITNDNIYNIKSINVEQLLINDSNISSIGDIANSAIQSSIDIIIKNNSFYWKTSKEHIDYNNLKYNVAYYDTNVIKRIAIGGENDDADAAAMVDIKKDICYNNKILKKFIKIELNTIFNTGVDITFTSSFIEIGNIKILSIDDKFYFELKLYSYDINTYYFQTINIYGNVYISPPINGIYYINNIYWNTSFNNSLAIQRIINIKYYYDNNNKIIKFYAEYNNDLNLIRSSSIPIIPFKNLIFFDEFHTDKITTFDFPDVTISLAVNVQTSFLSEAILTNKTILNKNATYTTSNIINNLFLDNLTFTNSTITKQNVLMIDNNANIVDTGISSNIFSGLKIASYNTNSIVGTDNRGILQSLQIPNNLLSNLNSISSLGETSAKIVTTLTNGGTGFETINFNRSNLDYLSSINTNINSVVVIDNNGILKTTKSLPYNNFNNLEETLKLFTFSNQPQQNVSITSNIILKSIYTSNIFIGNTSFTSNINLNRVLINNAEIGEDIFKSITKFSTITDIVSIEANVINNANPITNLFDKNINKYWESAIVFNNNNSFSSAVNINNNVITNCGAYFIITLSEPIVLTNYIFYVNYSNIINTIKSFKVFGFDDLNFDKLDEINNLILKNYFIPNNFNINKNNLNKSYKKFAFCITGTNNNTGSILSCILGAIELFGNKITTANKITYNTLNNTLILGNSNIGIKNLNPSAPLSIGADIYYNNKESLINLNHDFYSNSIEAPIINITKSSYNTPSIGAIHYINNLNTSNTNYTIKLTHNDYLNEKTILSMNSDGRIGIGSNPVYLHSNNGLSIFNNGLSIYENSNYINFQTNGILSSYNLVLPSSNGNINNVMTISSVNGNKSFFSWKNPLDIINEQSFVKLGNNNTITTRNENGIALQVAGSCLIGNNVSAASLSSLYLQNNTLVVSGNIYSTSDITTDSDIAYKYNIELIKNPLEKIKKLNGYIFNRNDTNDNEKYTGLIAQEVLKVMPEVIVKKHDGKLRVIYANLAGLFIEGFKKIDNNCDYLNTKINCCIFLIGCLFYLNAKNSIFN
jgi:hypothetical protein